MVFRFFLLACFFFLSVLLILLLTFNLFFSFFFFPVSVSDEPACVYALINTPESSAASAVVLLEEHWVFPLISFGFWRKKSLSRKMEWDKWRRDVVRTNAIFACLSAVLRTGRFNRDFRAGRFCRPCVGLMIKTSAFTVATLKERLIHIEKAQRTALYLPSTRYLSLYVDNILPEAPSSSDPEGEHIGTFLFICFFIFLFFIIHPKQLERTMLYFGLVGMELFSLTLADIAGLWTRWGLLRVHADWNFRALFWEFSAVSDPGQITPDFPQKMACSIFVPLCHKAG